MQNDQNAVRERHLKSLAAAVSNEFSNLSVSGGASYAAFTGATSITSGTGGLVPAPQAGEENYFLSGNGTWAPPTDTTYSIASTTEAGLMSAADKIKLDSIDGDAEENAIEEIWIDDVRQTIINKKVPLNLSDYAKKTTLDDYAKKADVASVWKRKGSVNSFSDLPTNAEEGDVYNIRTAGGVDDFGVSVQAGDNVARTFDGKWDVLAGTVDLSGYVEKVSGKQLSTEDFTTAQKNKLNNLALITSAGNGISISGGTIASSNRFANQVTLSGGLYSRATKSDLFRSSINAEYASINAEYASINAEYASIKGDLLFTDDLSFYGNTYFGGELTAYNTTINVDDSSINAVCASINADSASIYAGNATINGNLTFAEGFVAENNQIFLPQSSIDAESASILTWWSTIKAEGTAIYASVASIYAGNDSNALIITGDPKFTGNPTFTEPIYIDNTGSTVKGALCFDMDDGKPRLKMRIPGSGSTYTDYIFNCDTSITGGTG